MNQVYKDSYRIEKWRCILYIHLHRTPIILISKVTDYKVKHIGDSFKNNGYRWLC